MDRVLGSDSRVLITGATGFIGGEVLQSLEHCTAGPVWSLVRARNGESPAARLRERYHRSGRQLPPAAHVQPVIGDVTQPGWGLASDDLTAITRDVDIIIHSAADTSFAADRNPRATNVEGVRHLIELAGGCRRPPLIVYISTASNSGKAAHRCLPEEEGCRPANQHFNGYTQSKAEAEALLRSSGLPVLHLRPTIVLGADTSDVGFAKQILWCVPLMYRFPCLPLDPKSRLDLVDLRFIVDAALALMQRPRRFDCYHLSAGVAHCSTIGELGEVIHGHYGRKMPRLVPPTEWTAADRREMLRSPLHRRVYQSLRYYLPFLSMDVVFDDARLRGDLGPDAPTVRPPGSYLPDVLRLIHTRTALLEAALP